MAEHTPGPWQYRATVHWEQSDHGGYRWKVLMSPGSRAFQIAMVQVDDDDDEQEANARLIAAAPDLLEALELLLGDAEPWHAAHNAHAMPISDPEHPWHESIMAARKAIDKTRAKKA
jgi:hypothetical protein